MDVKIWGLRFPLYLFHWELSLVCTPVFKLVKSSTNRGTWVMRDPNKNPQECRIKADSSAGSEALGPKESVTGPKCGNKSFLSLEIQLEWPASFTSIYFLKENLIGLIASSILHQISESEISFMLGQYVAVRDRVWIQGNRLWQKTLSNSWYARAHWLMLSSQQPHGVGTTLFSLYNEETEAQRH